MYCINGIKLRKLRREDLELLTELKNESWLTTHHTLIVNNDNQEKWFDGLNDYKELVLIAENLYGVRIGVYMISNIDWMNRNYVASYSVFKKFRDSGYGIKIWEIGTSFGFNILNMHRINAEVLSNNKPSHKILMKCGFKKEGVKKQSVYKLGKYLDSTVYGLVKK